MIIDTSALIAVLTREPGFERYATAIAEANQAMISAMTLHETGVVLLRRAGGPGLKVLLEFLSASAIVVRDFGHEDAVAAVDAYAQYGKGIAPPGLNLGDCAVYALAKHYDMPVLSTSDEFTQAGLKPALV